jgi:hypothetical protein
MFIYDTKAQRQMVREHVEQLAQEMRHIPDPTASNGSPSRRVRPFAELIDLLQLRTRRLRRARLRAHIFGL